jgi:hypothetical protein
MTEPTPAPAPEPIAAPAAPAAAVEPNTILASVESPSIVPSPDPAGEHNWRDKFAGDDPKFRERLNRFADESAFVKSYRAMEQKFSSGEYKRQIGADAKPEEIAAWRKEMGIPDKPEGYVEKLTLPNGVVIGEADKPVVAAFADAALAANIPPAQFNALVAKHYEILDQQKAAQDDQDAQFKATAEDELRNAWQGADYRRNLTAVNNLLSQWPEELRHGILAARTPDGKKLGDMPAFIKQLAHLSMDLNPAATLVPSSGSDPAKGVEDRIAEIEKYMGTNRAEYFKDQKMQTELVQLYEAREKIKARAA